MSTHLATLRAANARAHKSGNPAAIKDARRVLVTAQLADDISRRFAYATPTSEQIESLVSLLREGGQR